MTARYLLWILHYLGALTQARKAGTLSLGTLSIGGDGRRCA